jgi:preprotein translocase subunit SecF
VTENIYEILASSGFDNASVQSAGGNTVLIRTEPIDIEARKIIEEALKIRFPTTTTLSFSTIGPIIGAETTKNALIAIAVSSAAILAYLTWSFRNIDWSIRYGIVAVATLAHDSLILIGMFALLGGIANVTIDSMFVTAVLTGVGFSVHDTIVVFDRIRENRRKYRDADFASVVNYSLNQTLDRSLNTSVTAVFVLTALLLIGGTTIREFALALLIGVVVGTYSSIFIASCLLVEWGQRTLRQKHSDK